MVTQGSDGERGRRDPYAVVGAATRDVIDRAARSKLTELDYRVLLAVVHLLTTWSRIEDHLGTKQLACIVYGIDSPAEPSGGQRRRVSRSLAKLARAGVLYTSPGKGRMARTIIRLETCFRDDTITGHERVPTRTRSGREHGLAASQMCSGDAGNVLPPRGTSENCSENSSESSPHGALEQAAKRSVDNAIALLAERYPTHSRSLRQSSRQTSRLRRALSAQIAAGWPVELLVSQVSQLTLDGMDSPLDALSKRVENLGQPPPTAAQQRERERQAAREHGATVGRTEGLSEAEIRELATSYWEYRDDPELQNEFLVFAGVGPTQAKRTT
jgi:hypothetical protein